MAKTAKGDRPASGSFSRIQDGSKPETEAEKRAACADLKKELARLAKDMPYEDLRFLVAQSLVLIRNREAESLEREFAESYEAANSSTASPKASAKAASKAARGSASAPAVQILKSSSGNANLVINGQFKLLTGEELAAIAKIAISDGPEIEVLERLYRWLYRERRDIILDAGMNGPASPTLRQLLAFCRKTFKKGKAKG